MIIICVKTIATGDRGTTQVGTQQCQQTVQVWGLISDRLVSLSLGGETSPRALRVTGAVCQQVIPAALRARMAVAGEPTTTLVEPPAYLPGCNLAVALR